MRQPTTNGLEIRMIIRLKERRDMDARINSSSQKY